MAINIILQFVWYTATQPRAADILPRTQPGSGGLAVSRSRVRLGIATLFVLPALMLRICWPSADHRAHKGLNNATEVAHRWSREREKMVGRAKTFSTFWLNLNLARGARAGHGHDFRKLHALYVRKCS